MLCSQKNRSPKGDNNFERVFVLKPDHFVDSQKNKMSMIKGAAVNPFTSDLVKALQFDMV